MRYSHLVAWLGVELKQEETRKKEEKKKKNPGIPNAYSLQSAVSYDAVTHNAVWIPMDSGMNKNEPLPKGSDAAAL